MDNEKIGLYIRHPNIRIKLQKTMENRHFTYVTLAQEQALEENVIEALDLIIYELDRNTIEQEAEQLYWLKTFDKLKILLIVDIYSTVVIDLALAIGIEDIMFLPFSEKDYIRKILHLSPKTSIPFEGLTNEALKTVLEYMNDASKSPVLFSLLEINNISDIEKKELEGLFRDKNQYGEFFLLKRDTYLILSRLNHEIDKKHEELKVKAAYQKIIAQYYTKRIYFLFSVICSEETTITQLWEQLQGGLYDCKYSRIFAGSCMINRK